MAHRTLMIAIDWYGPFSSLSDAAAEADSAQIGEALYLAYNDNSQSYVGVTGGVNQRFKQHYALFDVMKHDTELWIGIVASQSIPGRKNQLSYQYHSFPLRLAEQIIIYSLQPTENIHYRRSEPKAPGVVFSRWFEHSSPWARRNDRPHEEWPDLVEFDDEAHLVRKAWFGGRHEVLTRMQVAALREENSN